jgi:hypothetical protein
MSRSSPDSAMSQQVPRRIDAFFYGLFMDEAVLRQSGVAPVNARRAYVSDFALRIGQRATLVPSAGAKSFGMLVALTHAELDVLYNAPGLEQYRPEAIVVQALDGPLVPALCYNLREEPGAGEGNAEYSQRLRDVLTALDFPREYIDSVR